MKISVVTPSIRKEGLYVVKEALKRQTNQDFEWLIGSSFDPKIPDGIWVRDDFLGGYWSLNRIYNRLFSRVSGEIVVSWQDWIYADREALDKFLFNVSRVSAVVSGVGDQYERVGQFGKPEIKIWSDPRKTDKYGSFYECNPSDAEWNFCAFPTSFIYDVGGFCEKLDWTGFGMDGYQVNERWDLLGYKFYLDQANESYTIRHDRSAHGGKENWNQNNNLSNGQYEKVRQEFINKGEWPRMKYLGINK